MKSKLTFLAFAVALLYTSFAIAAGPQLKADNQLEYSIQQAIDDAEPGDVVNVPAGTYFEHITLKEGVILIGAGAGQTIIDGEGYGHIVLGAKNAMIIGCTVMNGRVGISNNGYFMGIFHCEVRDNEHMGIHIVGGSSVVANNLVLRNRSLAGIGCNSSNPFIINNTLIDNPRNGIWAWYPNGPTVINNVITGSDIGIHSGAGSICKTYTNNLADNVRHDILGKVQGETNSFTAVQFANPSSNDYRIMNPELKEAGAPIYGLGDNLPVGVNFNETPYLENYRELMTAVVEQVSSEHPIVVYDLTDDLGLFNVITKFSSATFSTRSSTEDTEIREFEAYDAMTDNPLRAEYSYNQYPTVVVRNEEYTEVELDRYVLENVYYHPDSYFADAKGHLAFKRETSFSRIEVVAPEGYIPIYVNYPATFKWEGNRVVVHINDIGYTHVKILMEEYSPMITDVYGILDM